MTSGGNSLSIPATAKSYALSLEFTPAQVEFGETFVGNEAITRTVTIKNTTPIGVTLTPNINGPFSALIGSFTLGPNQSQQVAIKYNPTESAALSTNFAFYANNGGVASSAGVNVSGTAHKITIDSEQIEFLRFIDGNEAATEFKVKVTNEGNTTTTLSALVAAKPNSPEGSPLPFDLTTPVNVGIDSFTLAASEYKEITVRFTSSVKGTFKCDLKLSTANFASTKMIPAVGIATTYDEYLGLDCTP